MNKKITILWKVIKPLLKKAKRKDFVLHTRMVYKAMTAIISKEGGDSDILIPAALLHDVGWSEVPLNLQMANDKKLSHQALVLHIKKAPAIITRILEKHDYKTERIEKIVRVVEAHKFTDPDEKDKQLLIDADALADVYKQSFYSDIKAYGTMPEDHLNFRSKNTFYTKTARNIFERLLKKREKEIIFYNCHSN